MNDWAVRTTLAVAGCLIAGAAAPLVSAQEKSACLEAHAAAQQLRKAGRLRGARQELAICTAPSCPPLVSSDCTTWPAEVASEQPSVVISARDRTGRDTFAVRVEIDGELVAMALDGRPIDVDPGEHRFRYELATGEVIESAA